MQQCHLQQLSRLDIYITLCKILHCYFVYETSYVTHSDYLVLIWKFYTVLLTLNFFKQENSFKQTRVDFFLPRKYDVNSQLRHSYVKGPFLCGAAHIWNAVLTYIQIFEDIFK